MGGESGRADAARRGEIPGATAKLFPAAGTQAAQWSGEEPECGQTPRP